MLCCSYLIWFINLLHDWSKHTSFISYWLEFQTCPLIGQRHSFLIGLNFKLALWLVTYIYSSLIGLNSKFTFWLPTMRTGEILFVAMNSTLASFFSRFKFSHYIKDHFTSVSRARSFNQIKKLPWWMLITLCSFKYQYYHEFYLLFTYPLTRVSSLTNHRHM